MRNENNEIYDIFLSKSYSQLKDLFKKAKSKQEQTRAGFLYYVI